MAPPATPPRPETAALDLTGRVTSGDNTRTDNKVARTVLYAHAESTAGTGGQSAAESRRRKPWPRYRDRMEDGAR